jgi:Ca-activated chloride channel homolog
MLNRFEIMKLRFVAFSLVLSCCFFTLQSIFTVKAQLPNPKTMSKPTSATPLPTSSPAPSPTPEVIDENDIIRVDTELVNVNVRVVDRNNRPISDVANTDFKVFEDNVLQPIDAIIRQEVTINYALVIDNSGSLRSQLEKVIEASKIIVNSNRPDDDVCVIRFVNSEKISIEQDFTGNKTLVNDALDQLFVEGGSTAVIDAVYLGVDKVTEHEKEKVGTDKKRRALILITDGEDRDSFYKEPQLFELLKESDVQIYPIGFVNELSNDGSLIRKSPKDQAVKLLTRLATETGGKAYFPNSVTELNEIALDIAKSLRTQYLISYSPTNEKRDGSFRSIKVLVADGKNKEKRIAITRTGRTAVSEGNAPVLQPQPNAPQKPKP